MSNRSLTQAEAEKRAALLAVERYDVAVDLTDLPTGPQVRCVSTVTFTCRETGADTFIDCALRVAGLRRRWWRPGRAGAPVAGRQRDELKTRSTPPVS
jgi:hypothetical protein